MKTNKKRAFYSEAQKCFSRYVTVENLKKMQDCIEKRDSYTKQYSRGGLSLHRGYYSPQVMTELIVMNISRGKLLKRKSGKEPDYIYYFDAAGNLVLVTKFPGSFSQEIEWIRKEDNTEFSIVLNADMDELVVTEAIYKNENLVEFFYIWCIFDEPQTIEKLPYQKIPKDTEITKERYVYDGEWLIGGEVENCNLYAEKYKVDFVYKDSALAGYYINNDKEFFYTVPPYLKELITGKKIQRISMDLAEELKKRMLQSIEKWKKIGAISLFINGDGGFLSELSLTYTTETDFKTMNEDTFEELFLDEEEVNLQQYIECAEHGDEKKAVLKATVKAVGELQQEGILLKQFGHPVPVIIHGYEYAGKEIKATRQANLNGEADDFINMLKRIGVI